MTNNSNPIAGLIYFFWGVTWRTVIISMLAAILVGIGLGYMQVHEGLSPELRKTFTSWSGIPVTAMTLGYVFIRQGLRFKAGV